MDRSHILYSTSPPQSAIPPSSPPRLPTLRRRRVCVGGARYVDRDHCDIADPKVSYLSLQ